MSKLSWNGRVVGVQPRIRLTRSFDQSSHSYLGYTLRVDGTIGGESRVFVVAIGKALHAKQQWRVGDGVSGVGMPVTDPNLETADLFKVSQVKRCGDGPVEMPTIGSGPPFEELCPPLEEYRERGHRRLAKRTYTSKCTSCRWGCEMAVEMIIDHWQPGPRKHRRETFCYGPKSCALYKPGPTRKVPGRRGMTWEEEDWVDEDRTSHRGPDE